MVKITVSGGGELEGSEADIIEGFVINDHALISIFQAQAHSKVVNCVDGAGS